VTNLRPELAGPPTAEWASDFAAIRPEWEALALMNGSIFATYEWHDLWWRHFGSGQPLLLVVRDATGGALAIVPLYRRRVAGVTLLRFIGHGPADEGGPIYAPGTEARFRTAMHSALHAEPWDIFLAERLLPGAVTLLPAGSERIRFESSPTIRLPGDWDHYMGQLGRRLRHEIRHDERKLRQAHEVRFRLSGDPSRLTADLDTLFALHRARWGKSQFLRLRDFHAEFAAVAQRRRWLRLWFLEVDDRPVAAWHGFRFGRAEFHYQVGRDVSMDHLSVGLLSTAHAIRMAIEDGMEEYRFLRGGESYKFRFAAQESTLTTAATPATRTGRLAVRAGLTLLRSGMMKSLVARTLANIG
jgi:CelD/BcsL family acetyltransferase involved in cellulose biosynthesis